MNTVQRTPYVVDGAMEGWQRTWFKPGDGEYSVVDGIRCCSLCGEPFGPDKAGPLHHPDQIIGENEIKETAGEQVEHWMNHLVNWSTGDVAPHWYASNHNPYTGLMP